MQPKICLLTDNEHDRETWYSFLSRLPAGVKDLHYTPEYLDLYRHTYTPASTLASYCSINNDLELRGNQGEPEYAALYYRDNDLEILQPLVFKPLKNLSFVNCGSSTQFSYPIFSDSDRINSSEKVDIERRKNKFFDVESPYGFGGALANRKISSSEKERYENHKVRFLGGQGGLTEFCSYHPLIENHTLKDTTATIKERKQCAYIDLTQSMAGIWQGIEERQRKAIVNARKKGIKIRRESLNDRTINEFYQRYMQTMQRVNAAEEWHFPDNYFVNCRDYLGENANSLFNAYVGETVIASFYLIHGFSTCYYHFSCSEPGYASYNANHLLMLDTALWAKSQGYHYYFLGGGSSFNGDDDLYRFKQSFTQDKKILYQSEQIFNTEDYEYFKNEKIAYEHSQGNISFETQYFPFYRG